MKSDRKMIIHIVCKHCGLKANIKVRQEDWENYVLGRALFDEAFPYLKNWEKRMILTEECGDCYRQRLFGNNLFKLEKL